jgi:REP element-mobilizing transposase RayT
MCGTAAPGCAQISSCGMSMKRRKTKDHVAQPPSAVPPESSKPPLAKPGRAKYKRNLPHIQTEGKTFFITFCTYKRWILPESIRDLVIRHCLHDHERKVWVHGLLVMPDHVHIIITPLVDAMGTFYSLAEILGSIKGASAHKINRTLGRKGHVWQDESFDQIFRSHENAREKVQYICENPVRKGIARGVQEYPWLWREWVEGQKGAAGRNQ